MAVKTLLLVATLIALFAICPQGQSLDGDILAYRLLLDEDAVDGMFMMPSQTCQLSTDPNDHEMYLQALEAFRDAVVLSVGS